LRPSCASLECIATISGRAGGLASQNRTRVGGQQVANHLCI